MCDSSKNPQVGPLDLFVAAHATKMVGVILSTASTIPIAALDAELRILDALEKTERTPAQRDGIEAMRRVVGMVKRFREEMDAMLPEVQTVTRNIVGELTKNG